MGTLSGALAAVGNIVVDSYHATTNAEFEGRGFEHGAFVHDTLAEVKRRLDGLPVTVARIGGSSVNKARVAGAFGIPVRVFGVSGRDWPALVERWDDAIGRDGTAGSANRTLRLRDHFARSAVVATGDGSWSVLTAPGDFADFDQIRPGSVTGGLRGEPANANPPALLTVEAYLANNLPWLAKLLEAAAVGAVPVHFDLGAPPLLARSRAELRALIEEHVAWCSGTEEEYAALLGHAPDSVSGSADQSTASRIADELLLETVVVKRGSRGATLFARGAGASRAPGGPSAPVTVHAPGSGVDTIPPYSIGCGDALDGTLLAARLAGAGSDGTPRFEHILQTAAAVAADVARRPLGDIDALPGAYTLGL